MYGIDPRMMKQAMKKMGVSQAELPVKRVIFELEDKNMVFEEPQVMKMDMMGETSYQIVGNPVEQAKDTAPEITEDDIMTVMQQADCSRKQAREVLEETGGDLAEAIMRLKGSQPI